MNAFEQWLPSSTFLYVLYFSNPYRGFHLEVFSLFKTRIPEARSESGMHLLFSHDYPFLGFAGGLDRQESACSARDLGSISGSRRSPGVGKGYPLQYSCLENSMDGGAWRATVHGVAKSRTRLSNWDTHSFCSGSVGVCTKESFSCSNTSGDSTYISLTRISSPFSVPNPLSHILCSGFNEWISQFPEKPCAIITLLFLFVSLPTFSCSLKSDATASLFSNLQSSIPLEGILSNNHLCLSGDCLPVVTTPGISWHIVGVQSLSRDWLFVAPRTVAHQAPFSTGFPRQECWSGLPFPFPGDLPDSGTKPASSTLASGFLTTEPPGKPMTLIKLHRNWLSAYID